MYLQYWHSIGVDIYDKDGHAFLKYLQSCYSDIYETLRAKTPIAPLSMEKTDRRIPVDPAFLAIMCFPLKRRDSFFYKKNHF